MTLVDQALLSHVLDNLGGDSDPSGTAAVGSLSRLREECRLAKERLSADTATQLVVELPGHRADVRLTREELQDLIRSPLDGVISALDEMTERNGAAPNGLAALAVVGGGASIPFVTQRLSEHTQLPVVTTPQPALNAAVGAALFAAFGADADAPTGAAAAAADDPDAPTGAAAAATDATAAAAVFDGPLPDEPGSATFRALAWSQEEAGEEPVPYTGENPYRITDTGVRPSGPVRACNGADLRGTPTAWHRVAQLAIGIGRRYRHHHRRRCGVRTDQHHGKHEGDRRVRRRTAQAAGTGATVAAEAGESRAAEPACARAAQRGDRHQRSAAATTTIADVDADDDGSRPSPPRERPRRPRRRRPRRHRPRPRRQRRPPRQRPRHQHHAVDDDELHQGPVRAGAGADPGAQPGSRRAATGLPAAGVSISALYSDALGLVAHWVDE